MLNKPFINPDDPTKRINMVTGFEVTDKDRYSRSIFNTTGDKVNPKRIEDPLVLDTSSISSYIEFAAISTPSTPTSTNLRLYHKSSGGADTQLFVLLDTGTELELISSASTVLSLDGAYNNGSSIAVDTSDVVWKLTGARQFRVTNAADSVTYFQVTSTRTDIATLRINSAYTLPSADGAANTIMRTDGAGTLSFASISTLGDGTYLRLDGTNDPITGTIQISSTNKLEFRDTALYINSVNDGYLDFTADIGFRFNTGIVGINKTTPAAWLDIAETAGSGTVNPSLLITGAAHTALTASTERNSIRLNFGQTIEYATGALTAHRTVRIDAQTISAVGASTVTDAATVWISGAPVKSTNATLTSTHGLLIAAGAVSTATAAYGLTVNAPTGATNNYAAQFLGAPTVFGGPIRASRTSNTISGGVITVTSSYVEVDTEAAAATDDLDTINGGDIGDILILEAANDARDVVVKNGTGNIYLSSAADKTLDDGKDKLMLIRHSSTEWHQISFFTNA